MPRLSAGILLYRKNGTGLEVFRASGWAILEEQRRGLVVDSQGAVRRKRRGAGGGGSRVLLRRSGFTLGAVEFRSLGGVEAEQRQGGFCVGGGEGCAGRGDPEQFVSDGEGQPKSGKMQEFPEVDRAGVVRHEGGAGETARRAAGVSGSAGDWLGGEVPVALRGQSQLLSQVRREARHLRRQRSDRSSLRER